MTTKTAEKTEAGTTGDLGLKGAKPGKHKKLDGTEVDERPDSLVVEAARAVGSILDRMERAKADYPQALAQLESAFKKSKRQRVVRVTTEFNTWLFRAEQGWKIVKKNETKAK